jgi:large subunit ribosomal protein L32
MKVRPDTPNRLEKIMAVQKSRRTPATRGARRAHDKLKNPALSVDPTSGETHLRHRVTPDGFYRGNQVVSQPDSTEDEE